VGYLRRIGLQMPAGAAHDLSRKAPALQAPWCAQQAGIAATASDMVCMPTEGDGSHGTGPLPRPCCLLGCGFEPKAVERSGRASWLQPRDGHDVGLKVANSLTGGEKEPFKPLVGKTVRWYTCGPTVYDVAHMGHARAYLTFDILRRIMADYFQYDLIYQINITDIDDKIILRSRQNKLFSDFVAETAGQDISVLKCAVDEAVALMEKKLLAKKPEEPAAGAPEKDRVEFEKLRQEHELKLSQLVDLKKKVASAAASREGLLEAARDPLMAKLDKDRGHTVSDHSIFDAHARRFEDEYFEDMDALGVLRPDVKTRISEYMDGRVQQYIEKLEDDGFCYESNGSVYFSIDAFRRAGYDYRKLVPAASTSAAEMEEGEGALASEAAEKRNPNDFAVWKKSKPGEPAWESRWGPGRPGWHIECSVMANDIHKEFLDIHGGGEDLKFPHHDNEMAQSEAYNRRPQWVNYFWHAGHLHIEGLKMSKSLKNFVTIREALAMHSARQLRLLFLLQPWDKGMNYSDRMIETAKVEERRFKHFFGYLRYYQRFPEKHSQSLPGERESKLAYLVAKTEHDVDNALKDNFSTGGAISSLSKLVSECYVSLDALPAASLEPVCKARDLTEKVLKVFGVEGLVLTPSNEADLTPALDAFADLRKEVRKLMGEKAPVEKVAEAAAQADPAIQRASAAGLSDCADAFRAFASDIAAMAKAGKPAADFLKRCDQVRDKDFVALGVRLFDRGTASEGYVWMFDDRSTLERELKEQAEKQAAAARDKLLNKLAAKKQELKAAEKASVSPDTLFKHGTNAGVYSEFDDAGVPTKLADGGEVPNKKRKDLAKELAKQQKDFEKLRKQAGEAGIAAFLDKLRAEVDDLSGKVGAQ